VDVQVIRKSHVIGHVTKSLTKSLSRGEKGVHYEEPELGVISQDENGNIVEERHTYTVELVAFLFNDHLRAKCTAVSPFTENSLLIEIEAHSHATHDQET
jgi:hypothetical protein